MKNLFLLSFLIAFYFSSFAQEKKVPKQSLRVGLNGAFWGSGDMLGKVVYGEYIIPLNERLAISPRISSGGTSSASYSILNKGTEFEFSSENFEVANSFLSSISLQVNPFKNTWSNFSFNLGLAYHHWEKIYGQQSVGFNNTRDINYYSDKTIGLCGSLNLLIINTNKIEMGARSELITGFSPSSIDAISLQTGIFLGVKL